LRKTGGGINESDPLSELELRANSLSVLDKKIIKLIGATALTGIKGGLDTSDLFNDSQETECDREEVTATQVISPSPESHDVSQEMNTQLKGIEVLEIPSKTHKRKFRENDIDSDSIAFKMLETQVEIKNALLELVDIKREMLEIKKQKLELFKLNPHLITNVEYYNESNDSILN